MLEMGAKPFTESQAGLGITAVTEKLPVLLAVARGILIFKEETSRTKRRS